MKQGEAEQVCGLASTNREVNNLTIVIMLQLQRPSVSVSQDARLLGLRTGLGNWAFISTALYSKNTKKPFSQPDHCG
jgi:hypothetical protein